MADKILGARQQQKRGTASAWATSNPVLAAGEIGFETDTGKIKIGDGTSTWSALAYIGGEASSGSSGGVSLGLVIALT